MTSNLHLRRGLLWAMDMLCRVLYLGSAILSLTSCVSITNAADGPTIGENANRFELAKYILTQQIKPLALKGMAGRQAIYTLLNKGYYCGVKTESVTGLNIDPGVNCIKQLSRYESRCDEFLLQLYFSPKKPKLSQIEFVNQLDAETVIGTTALCPYTPELSTDFVKYRGKAEAELRKYVRKTNVETERLDRAYEKLLMEKFYCGFAPNNDVKKSSASAPKLLCNTRSLKNEQPRSKLRGINPRTPICYVASHGESNPKRLNIALSQRYCWISNGAIQQLKNQNCYEKWEALG